MDWIGLDFYLIQDFTTTEYYYPFSPLVYIHAYILASYIQKATTSPVITKYVPTPDLTTQEVGPAYYIVETSMTTNKIRDQN